MNQINAVDYDKIKYRLYERNGVLVLSLQLLRQEYDEFNNVVDKTVDFYVVKDPKNIKEILSSLANSSKRISLKENDLIVNDRDGNQLAIKDYEKLQKRRELKQFSSKLEKRIEKLKCKKKCKNVRVHDKESKLLKVKRIAHDAFTAMGVVFTIGSAIAFSKSNSNSLPFFPRQMQERRVDEEPIVNKTEKHVLDQELKEAGNFDYKYGIVTASSNFKDVSAIPSSETQEDLNVQAIDIGADILNEQVDAITSNDVDASSSVESNTSGSAEESFSAFGSDMIEQSEDTKIEESSSNSVTDDDQNLMDEIDKVIKQANDDMKVIEETQPIQQKETEDFQFDISKEETDEELKAALATEEDIASIEEEAASQVEVENIIEQNSAPVEPAQVDANTVILSDNEITEIAKQMLASNATPEEIEHVAIALVNGENLNAAPQYGTNYIEKFALTPEQIDTIKATVRHEAGANPRENYAVMSTVIRRCESGAWGGGNNPYDVITAPGQFESYLKGHYKKYANGQYPECTDEIVDAMLTGQLEPFHDKERFSSGSGATGEQYTSNGNHFR